jgi:hypothetical protein
VDVVFADAVVIDDRGRYVCDRKAILPQKFDTLHNMSFLTCSTFMRRRLVHEKGILFDASLRDVGDGVWALELIKRRVKMGILREITTAFTDTGANMNLLPNARREREELQRTMPLWARKMTPFFIAQFRLRRLLAGAYVTKPYEYRIYTRDSPTVRKEFTVPNPTFRWVRVKPALAETGQPSR